MSAHVLLNLFNFNKLRKSDIIRGLLSILSLFRIEFNIFTNTGAQLFNRFYLSYDISIALKSFSGMKKVYVIMYTTLLRTSLLNIAKYVNH